MSLMIESIVIGPIGLLVLFVTKRHQRIHSRCAARGEITSQKCHDGDDQRDHHERWSIRRADAEEQPGYHARQRECTYGAEHDANEGQNQSLAHHEPEHITSLCAERDSYPDLVRTLRYRIVDDTKHTDHREQERDCREDAEQ